MICAYAADAADFTNNGLGPLQPIECTVSETLNGMWEMTLIHALDGEKSARLAIGNIIRAPVPAGFTPAVKYGGGAGGGKEIYKVTTSGMRLYLRAEPSQTAKGLHAYRPNTEVTVLDKTAGGGKWYEAVTPDGRHGYMWAENLTYVRTEGSAEAAAESIREAQALRDQPFRIYKIVPGLDKITVYARHIFYDLADNLLGTCKIESQTGAAAAAAILANCRGEAGAFRIYSDLDGEISADWTDKTPVEAIFGSEGLTELTGGEIARDWWDIYAVKRVGRDGGVTVRQGKNLKSLGGELNVDDVATRIVPIGTDADGSALYLPEGYIDSELIDSYPLIKWARLDVREAKEVKSGKNRRTKDECYELMRAAAKERFDSGCDGAAYTLDIDFVNLADTDEYAAYAGVSDLALGDSVRVISSAAGVDVAMRLTDYVYDCLAKRYKSVSLGALSATIASNTLSARQLPTGGVTGAKIAPGAVGARALQDGAVGSLKIALAAIEYAHINQAAIKQLSADSLTAQIAHINALTAGTIDADELTAAWAKLYTIIAGQIEAGTIAADTITAAMAKLTAASVEHAEIDWANISKLTAAMANIATASIGDADIDFAQVKQLKAGTAVADQLITHDAVADRYFIDKLQVRALQVLEQTVGSLTVKASDGNYYRLDIDPEAGTVVPTLVSLSDDEKAEGVTGDQSRCIIETDLTVADLAASNVKAINALIDKLTASRIEVDTLFAREATVGALDAYLVRADTIAALEGALNVWANEKVNLAVGALAIGGTNLIRGTRKMTAANWYGMTGTGKALVELGNDFAGEKIERSGLTSAAYTSCYAKTDNVVTAGKAYILTADSYIDPSGTALDGNASLTLVFYSASGTNLQSTAVRLSSESPTGAWKQLEVKATAPDNAAYAQITMMLSKNGNVTFTRLKLEEGNKATAWSPAPEDTDDSINSVKSELNLVPGEISAAVNNVQVGGTNLVRLGALAIVNASGRAAEQMSRTWYRESEHQTTILPYSGGACWLNCPNISIAAGKKYTLSYYAWIQPDAESSANKFRPNLFGGTTGTDKYLTDFIAFVRGTPTKYTVTFDTTGWTAGDYALRFVMLTGQTHEVYFTDIKLEEGTKATAWSPSPNEVRIGSNILLDLYHTMLKTPYFEVDVSGENGDFKADETGLSAKVGTFEVLNAPDVARYYTGPASITLSAGADVKILSDALSNRILTGDVTIGITGEVCGALELRGIGGYGRITINGGGNTLNGYINLYCNSVPIEINSVKVSRATQRQCININNCTEVKTYGCVFNGNASSGNAQGLRATYSGLFIQSCEFYNIPDSALAFSYGADALVLNCKGAATYCLWADGATVRMAGSRPSGTCSVGNPSFLLPSDPSTVTVDTGSATPAETPVTTASYTATTTGTYYPSGHWINDNTIRQGHEGTGSNGRKDYGCMWFGAGALAGKTVKSATLTIKRIAGKGRSSSVVMKLWTTTVTGKSGVMAASTLTSLGEIGKIGNGETVTVNVPVSAIATIAAGGGLVLYTEETANASGKTYSANYAHFEGTDGSAPVLTVTYQ